MPDEESRVLDEAPDDVADRLRQIEEGVVEARVDASLDEIDAEFEARAQAVKARAAAAREKQAQETEKRETTARSDAESQRGLAVGMSIAYAIVGVPLAGFGLGWLADRASGGVVFQAVGLLTGCVLGMVYAIRALSRR